jgi:inorganic pyrophosphatase
LGINVPKSERDLQIRAVIKSNLVCGDIADIEKLVDELFNDINDVLDAYDIANEPKLQDIVGEFNHNVA